MNQPLKQFIDLLEQELPPLCSDRDLIRAGVVGSSPTASRLRSLGEAPNHFKLGKKKIRYLKGDIIEWVEKRYCSGGKNGSP